MKVVRKVPLKGSSEKYKTGLSTTVKQIIGESPRILSSGNSPFYLNRSSTIDKTYKAVARRYSITVSLYAVMC